MAAKNEWFENEAFWQETASFLFSQRRFEATPGEVDLILERLESPPAAQILDLCCGPGRHSLELSRRGFQVTGVDRNDVYLEQARRAAAAENLDIEFVRDDMRHFARPASFDLVLNLYTSFGYFADSREDRHVAENVYRSLRPGGQFILEMFGKEILARTFRERDWMQREDGSYLLEERELSDDWGRVKNRWIIVRAGQAKEFHLDLRLYSAVEMKTLLTACGFEDVRCFGSLDGEPYDQNAKRLVAVARKGS